MFTRKQYIIDKKLQLRTTFSVVRFVVVVTAIIIIAVGVNIAENNKKMDNILVIQDNIVQVLTTKTLVDDKDVAYKAAIRDIARNHAENMNTLNEMIRYNYILLIIIVILVVLETIALFIILIIRTHRISGPIFVMTRCMNEIIEGKDPVFRPLRKKDELKKFYDLLQQTIKAVRERK